MGKTVTLKVKFGVDSEPPPPAIVTKRVRKWGDPVLDDLLDADTGIVGSNFQIVKTCSFLSNGGLHWNAIDRYQVVDYNYLESIQRPTDGYTLKQVMNWLVNVDGKGDRPYWMNGTSKLYFGPFVFGGQLIQIDPAPAVKWGRYPGRDKDEEITFYRLIGLRRADFGKYTHETRPHLIQRATAAGNGNVYSEFPKGEIFHPVWSDIDFPANVGDGKLWIAEKFLE